MRGVLAILATGCTNAEMAPRECPAPVLEVQPGSIADIAGLRAGDCVVAYGERSLRWASDLVEATRLAGAPTLPLTFRRAGVLKHVVVPRGPLGISLDVRGDRTNVANPALREELLRMGEEDQRERRSPQDGTSAPPSHDQARTERLRQLVKDHGWPVPALVGDDGANAAWLIAQHADLDVAFQRHCLALLERAAASVPSLRPHVAYLYDRVAVNEGRPQRYGTQFDRPIELPESVDERRAAMGLGTLAEYLQRPR
jgi:hypothetical protein